MPHAEKPYCCVQVLAVTALCIALAGCSQQGKSHAGKSEKGKEEAAPTQKRVVEARPTTQAHETAKKPKLNIGKCTLLGSFREFNNDAFAVREFSGWTLCLVAHGMGGKVGDKVLGQVAYERAFEVLTRELKGHLSPDQSTQENQQIIKQAFVTANQEVMALENQLGAMGATIVLSLWREGHGLYLAGLGDCRVYLVRGDKIQQLTVDHSLAQALVEAKTITAEEAKIHRFRNVLWKYLGTKEVGVGPDVTFMQPQARDRILLCTNGLHSAVPDDRILSGMLQHGDVQKCADALCQSAVDAGTRWNVACIVFEQADNK